jgi:hypothetical protein
MRRAIPAIAAVLLAAGCASGSHGSTAPEQPSTTSSSAAPASSGAPKPSPTPTATALPALAVGQTVTVHTSGDGVVIKTPGVYEVTLLAFKTATHTTDPGSDYTATAQAGDVIGCIAFKVKNEGASQSDLYPFMNPEWSGASGQVSDSELATGADCAPLDGQTDELSGDPNPAIGQYVTGDDALEFPAGAGRLLFQDRSGASLFTIAVPPTS